MKKIKNTWICPKDRIEWSDSIRYCRQCALRERLARRKY